MEGRILYIRIGGGSPEIVLCQSKCTVNGPTLLQLDSFSVGLILLNF
jgi:exopolyphosphatase/pppGpp-phosphohydrolase